MTDSERESREARDAQLRRRMLNLARLNGGVYQNGFVPFGLFAGVKDDAGVPCVDEGHALTLISDLLEWGLLEEAGSHVSGGTSPSNRHRRFRFTTKGYQLWSREIPPIAGVADDRVI